MKLVLLIFRLHHSSFENFVQRQRRNIVSKRELGYPFVNSEIIIFKKGFIVMKMKLWLFCAVALLSIQTALAQTTAVNVPVKATDDTAPEITRGGYLVGPGDVITGKIMGEPQFDFTATINEDGKFQVPFFEKSIMAKCRTENELRADVKQLLSKYLISPRVSVAVTTRNSRPPATIYGEIRAPQQIKLERKARLLELLAFAGGVTEKAGGSIQIFHTQPPMCEETYEDGSGGAAAATDDNLNFPYRIYSLNMVQQGSEQANPLIYPGDVVVVKEALPVYIVGEVNGVGKVTLPEGGLPLSQALASVGGVRPQAKIKDIKIYRLKANSKDREIVSVNYDAIKKGKEKDVMLSPFDIVEVGKAPKSIGQFLTEIALGNVRTAAGSLGGLPQTVLR